MDEAQEKFLTHLRSTHLSLVLLCLAVAFAISQISTADTTKAKNQLTGIIESINSIGENDLLTDDEATNYAGFLRYRIVGGDRRSLNFPGSSPITSITESEDDLYVLYLSQSLKRYYWKCEDPFVPTVDHSPYMPLFLRLSADVSLKEFVEVWNDLGEVILVNPAAFPATFNFKIPGAQAFVIGELERGATYLSGVPILLTCLDGERLSFYLTVGDVNQNSKQLWNAEIRRNIGPLEDHDAFSPLQENWRSRLAKGIEFLPQGPNPPAFKESFPELEYLTRDFQSESLEGNMKLLQAIEKIDPASIDFWVSGFWC